MVRTHIASCIEPMLAHPGVLPDDPSTHAYEVKWDGYRAIAQMDGRHLQMCSRSGIDLLPAFSELAVNLARLPRPLILDGEIVALDADGRSGFSALQTRMPAARARASSRHWDAKRWRIAYVVFDILRCGRYDLLNKPWHARREQLETLQLPAPTWVCPPVFDDGAALLRAVAKRDGEGIIAKHRTSIYQPGRRSHDWLKIKLTKRDEFVIGGYWCGGADRVLGSLLLGYQTADGALQYAGRVGTGFDGAERRRLRTILDQHSRRTSPFATAVDAQDVVWSSPRLVVEIGYAEWTHDGILRHARYAGLRPDKAAADVVRLSPQETPVP